MARKRKPAAHAAVIAASLKIAQEHARILEASTINAEDNKTPAVIRLVGE